MRQQTTTMPPPLPRYTHATRFLLHQRDQSSVGKPFRNGMQTCTSTRGGTPKNCITKVDGKPYHLIGTAGNELWATGEWSETGQGKNGEPLLNQGLLMQTFMFVRAMIGRSG